jgi:hypothetical protein
MLRNRNKAREDDKNLDQFLAEAGSGSIKKQKTSDHCLSGQTIGTRAMEMA